MNKTWTIASVAALGAIATALLNKRSKENKPVVEEKAEKGTKHRTMVFSKAKALTRQTG